MRIEVFNRSKYRDGSAPGDDVPLAVPGQVFGVFDGATDPRGTRLNGLATGRLAALVAAAEMAAVAADPALAQSSGRAIIDRLAAALRRAVAGTDLPIPPSTTVAVALDCGADWRFVLFGDSGLRINGTEVFRPEKRIDHVSTHARVAAFERIRSRLGDADAVETAARRAIFLGFDGAVESGLLTADEAKTIKAATATATGLADAADQVADFLAGGIQTQHRLGNATGNPLCFETLNGTASALSDLLDFRRPKAGVTSIELFTDGYAVLPRDRTVAAWEAAFAEVDAADYHRIGPFATVKGSTSTEFFDDRTIVIVETGPQATT